MPRPPSSSSSSSAHHHSGDAAPSIPLASYLHEEAYELHSACVNDLALVPRESDDTMITVSVSDDTTIVCFNWASDDQPVITRWLREPVTRICILPLSNVMLTGHADGSVVESLSVCPPCDRCRGGAGTASEAATDVEGFDNEEEDDDVKDDAEIEEVDEANDAQGIDRQDRVDGAEDMAHGDCDGDGDDNDGDDNDDEDENNDNGDDYDNNDDGNNNEDNRRRRRAESKRKSEKSRHGGSKTSAKRSMTQRSSSKTHATSTRATSKSASAAAAAARATTAAATTAAATAAAAAARARSAQIARAMSFRRPGCTCSPHFRSRNRRQAAQHGRVFESHSEAIMSLFSITSSTFCSASRDQTIRWWDVSRADAELHAAVVPDMIVTHGVACPRGELAGIVASRDNKVRIWDHRSCAVVQTLDQRDGHSSRIDVSPDGHFVLTSPAKSFALASRVGGRSTPSFTSRAPVQVWDRRTGTVLARLFGLPEEASVGIFLPDYASSSLMCLCAGKDGMLYLWDLSRNECVTSARVSNAPNVYAQSLLAAPLGRSEAKEWLSPREYATIRAANRADGTNSADALFGVAAGAGTGAGGDGGDGRSCKSGASGSAHEHIPGPIAGACIVFVGMSNGAISQWAVTRFGTLVPVAICHAAPPLIM